MLQHLDRQDEGNLNSNFSQSLYEYHVLLSSGEVMYLLAANSMHAAYSALELSEDRNTTLVNVRKVDEWD